MKPPFNSALRSHRERAGFSESWVGLVAGMSVCSYGDMELHEDEWRVVPPLYQLLTVVRLLSIELPDFIAEDKGRQIQPGHRPGEVIARIRTEQQMSQQELAERCGFHPEFSVIVESNDGILLFPLEVSGTVCHVLGISLRSFIKHAVMTSS